jgi:hypothetical protein
MTRRLRALDDEIFAEGPDWWKRDPQSGVMHRPGAAAGMPAGP